MPRKRIETVETIMDYFHDQPLTVAVVLADVVQRIVTRRQGKEQTRRVVRENPRGGAVPVEQERAYSGERDVPLPLHFDTAVETVGVRRRRGPGRKRGLPAGGEAVAPVVPLQDTVGEEPEDARMLQNVPSRDMSGEETDGSGTYQGQ